VHLVSLVCQFFFLDFLSDLGQSKGGNFNIVYYQLETLFFFWTFTQISCTLVKSMHWSTLYIVYCSKVKSPSYVWQFMVQCLDFRSSVDTKGFFSYPHINCRGAGFLRKTNRSCPRCPKLMSKCWVSSGWDFAVLDDCNAEILLKPKMRSLTNPLLSLFLTLVSLFLRS
jgi:hypothetical protein